MHSSHQPANGISLQQILPAARFFGGGDVHVTSCCQTADDCRPGDLFVALVDVEADGHDLAEAAVRRGATAILAERPLPVAVPVCVVDDSREAYGRVCQHLAGLPAESLATIGVTGTNGKTTTGMLIASLLHAGGNRVGVTSTIGHSDSLETLPAHRTTPIAPEMADLLRRMGANGCSHAVLELSSRGLAQRRTAGIRFDAAVLTNLRRDHLDYHGSLPNYRKAKSRLFENLKPHGFAVLNADDPGSAPLLRRLTCPVITVGLRSEAEVTAEVIERHKSEQTFLILAGNESAAVRTRMIGDWHVANCLSATAVGLVMGLDLTTIARGLEAVERVPARMERIECGQDFGVYIDCADTPDRLAVGLKTLRQVTPGRVLCVFSAADDRPCDERPLLGRVVEKSADVGVITASTLGQRPSLQVAHDILDGYRRPAKAHAIPSRDQAIRWALNAARPGDSLLIAGGGRSPWLVDDALTSDDVELARNWLYEAGGQESGPVLSGMWG